MVGIFIRLAVAVLYYYVVLFLYPKESANENAQ